jgi:hypothetical protein
LFRVSEASWQEDASLSALQVTVPGASTFDIELNNERVVLASGSFGVSSVLGVGDDVVTTEDGCVDTLCVFRLFQ